MKNLIGLVNMKQYGDVHPYILSLFNLIKVDNPKIEKEEIEEILQDAFDVTGKATTEKDRVFLERFMLG